MRKFRPFLFVSFGLLPLSRQFSLFLLLLRVLRQLYSILYYTTFGGTSLLSPWRLPTLVFRPFSRVTRTKRAQTPTCACIFSFPSTMDNSVFRLSSCFLLSPKKTTPAVLPLLIYFPSCQSGFLKISQSHMALALPPRPLFSTCIL